MKKLLPLGVMVCLLLPGLARPQERDGKKAGADEAQSLQGEWQQIDFQTRGMKSTLADSVRELKNSHCIFKDDARIEFRFSQNWLPQERSARFRLDPSKTPKEIDLVIHWRDPEWKDLTLLGIYSLERNRLTICTNNKGKRPTEFKSTKENGNTLTVYQRVGGDPGVTLEFAQIQNDWVEASPSATVVSSLASRPKADIPPDPSLFAQRYLKFAEAHPDGFPGLVALCRAAFLAPYSDSGEKALSLLESGRVDRADLGDLCRALTASRTNSSETTAEVALAPHVLGAVKRQLAHPDAARTLAWVCVSLAREQSTSSVFAESEDLIVTRFANSPDIVNFCEILIAGRTWSAKTEQDLRTILDKNQDRAVRAAASFALASVVERGGETRQNEAEALFEEFISKFDGKEQYQYVGVEKLFNESAKRELNVLKTRALGKPAPEIDGVDLDGRGMTLSQFRGKVVLLSFWATWCRPCMKMVPHEQSLVDRLRNKPFELVGVNGDTEPERLNEGIREHKISWRSFRNKVGNAKAISDQWSIRGWPTLYLIDQKGIIRNRWTDTVSPEVLDREIDQLMTGKFSAISGLGFLVSNWSLSIGVGLGILGVVVAAAITRATLRRRTLRP